MRFRGTTIRRKIVALLLIPLVSLTAIWIFAATITSRAVFGRPDVRLMTDNVVLPAWAVVADLQQERKAALLYAAGNRDAKARGALDKQEQATDAAIARLRTSSGAVRVRNSLDDRARTGLDRFLTGIRGLPTLRAAVDAVGKGKSSREATYTGYDDLVGPGLALFDNLNVLDSVDLEIQRRSVIGLARADEELSRQDALLSAAISTGRMSGAELTAFRSAVALERGYYDDNLPALDARYRAPYDGFLNSAGAKKLRSAQDDVVAADAADAPIVAAHDSWPSVAGNALGVLGKVNPTVDTEFGDRLATVPTRLIVEAALAGGLGLIAVVASVLVSVRIGRGLIRDLTGLRQEAAEVAGTRLPHVMRRLAAGEAVDVETEVPKLSYAHDEIGQVGQALNTLQRAAVEAAVRQADMRKGVSDVFVNLARRSQVLLHRQLTLLDAMERRTEAPEELADLFRLDHMTTRMRRHAEGLVILSGAAPSRQWRKPVQLMDVVRAAVAEVEDYERIEVRRLPRLAVAGAAVADLTHLLAELIENAAVFSPPTTQVRLHGDHVANGFVLEIDDRGLGLTPDALLEANLRLAETPEFELSDTDRLGLFVVGRLAQRHGVRVSLRQSPYGGTTAVVLIPSGLLTESGEDTGSTRIESVPAPATSEDTEHTFRQWGLDGAGGERQHAAHADDPFTPTAPAPDGPLGLPRRRRRAPVLVADRGRPVGRPQEGPQDGPQESPQEPDAADGQPDEGAAVTAAGAEPAGPAPAAGPAAEQAAPVAAAPLPPEEHARPEPGTAVRPAPLPPARPAPAADLRGGSAPPPPPAGGGSVLPRRVRQASLAPQLRQAAPPERREQEAAARERSAEEVRDRMAALQRGWTRGRAADPDAEPDDDPATPAPRTTSSEGNAR